MKIIICGSRSFTDYKLLCETMDALTAKMDLKKLTIISGHARGADRLGEEWAYKRRVHAVQIYHPNYDKYGKAAPIKRNQEMIEAANSKGGLVCFWDSVSTGTEDMIVRARKAKLKVKIVLFDPDEEDE